VTTLENFKTRLDRRRIN